MNYLIALCSILFQPSPQQDTILIKEFIYNEAPFVECHASTIESTSQGMVAAWFGGTKEANKDVEIWMSREVKGKWSTPVSVANGIQHSNKRYPCWNPVLFQVPDGVLMLFYKVGPSPSAWWGMLKTSEDGGKNWSAAQRLPEDILGPIKNKPVLMNDGRLICPSSTEVGPNEGWRLHFETTTDLGKTWQRSEPVEDPLNYNAIQPSILTYRGDTLQLLARTKDSGVVAGWSYNKGMSWTNLKPVGLPNPNSGTDAVTLKNGLQLLVYNHSGKPAGKWSGPRSPLNVAISPDGISWKMIATLENEPGEYSYPAVVQAIDSKVHITYTWKRRKIRHIVIDPAVLDISRYPEWKASLASYNSSSAKANPPKTVASVIFDTDMGNDVDDVLALAMLYNYQKKGMVHLLGITINKANRNTIPFIDLMNRHYGYTNIPIGYVGDQGATPDDGKYLASTADLRVKGNYLYERKLTTTSVLPEAWKLQRSILAKQPDHSVTIISVGFSTNLAQLLKSGPDAFSPLSGYELVKRKVKLLSVMAGNFHDSSKAEYNIVKDISSASYVFEQWPAPIIISGWEIGQAIQYPSQSIEKDYEGGLLHPLVYAYHQFQPMPYNRETWDLTSVLVAVEGVEPFFDASPYGQVVVGARGTVSFNHQSGALQRYLVLRHDKKEQVKRILVDRATGKFNL